MNSIWQRIALFVVLCLVGWAMAYREFEMVRVAASVMMATAFVATYYVVGAASRRGPGWVVVSFLIPATCIAAFIYVGNLPGHLFDYRSSVTPAVRYVQGFYYILLYFTLYLAASTVAAWIARVVALGLRSADSTRPA